jgi:hypothetical protein
MQPRRQTAGEVARTTTAVTTARARRRSFSEGHQMIARPISISRALPIPRRIFDQIHNSAAVTFKSFMAPNCNG